MFSQMWKWLNFYVPPDGGSNESPTPATPFEPPVSLTDSRYAGKVQN